MKPAPSPSKSEPGSSTSLEPEKSPAPAQNDPLVDEVQSFVAKRAELAKKIAEEIKATEKKLADLRKTAAMLSPEIVAAPKDRKPKPSKPKTAKREEKPEPPTAPETPQSPGSE